MAYSKKLNVTTSRIDYLFRRLMFIRELKADIENELFLDKVKSTTYGQVLNQINSRINNLQELHAASKNKKPKDLLPSINAAVTREQNLLNLLEDRLLDHPELNKVNPQTSL